MKTEGCPDGAECTFAMHCYKALAPKGAKYIRDGFLYKAAATMGQNTRLLCIATKR